MTIKQQIDTDLKQAMLAGDKELVSMLRGIKSVVLDAEIAQGQRDQGLDDQQVTNLLQKESKKRLDAILLYQNAGEQKRADNELYEQSVIKAYLPEPMEESKVAEIIDQIIVDLGGEFSKQQMGSVIATTKQQTKGAVDGATIARLVQAKLS